MARHHHHSTTCPHDAEGPRILWLCGYEPVSSPKSAAFETIQQVCDEIAQHHREGSS